MIPRGPGSSYDESGVAELRGVQVWRDRGSGVNSHTRGSFNGAAGACKVCKCRTLLVNALGSKKRKYAFETTHCEVNRVTRLGEFLVVG
jgi:hypothetical protein